MISTAYFSACQRYRFKLSRYWGKDDLFLLDNPDRFALFIMLNPSTADLEKNDPTVAKCIRLARRWGFGGVEIRNIFAIRGTDPKVIRQVENPVGDGNTAAIESAVRSRKTGLIVAAWGNHGKFAGRSADVRAILTEIGRPVYCFALSKSGEPVHPLYQTECDLEGMKRWI
jgi:hypothetical protein